MKKKVGVLALGGLAVGMVALSGCSSGSSGDGKIELTFSAWGNPAELKVYQRAVDAFNEQSETVEVDLTGIPNDNYFQTLTTRLQGGQAPDLFYVGAEDISTLISNGTIEPLNDFLESDASFVKADEFADGLWGASQKDDEIYGLPVDCNPFLMYYNQGMFEEFGIKSPQEYFDEGNWNWEAMEEVTTQLREAGKYGFVQEGGHGNIMNWVWANGGLFEEDNQIVADEDDLTLEAFEFVERMVSENNFIFSGTLPEGQGMDAMFMSNQVGMVGAGRWLTPMFLETNIEFDYIPWPTNTEEQIPSVNIATAYMSANANGDHVEEAMEFVSFYTSQLGQETRLDGEGNAVPSVGGIDEVVTNQDKPDHGSYLLDARDVGRVVGYEFTSPGLNSELADIYEVMLLGDLTPEEAIDQAADIAREMLEES
ncbi:ABC transporter substrate-binding protein [Alkalicoccobacillus porphyridii]|uniref:Sugar ABC transporter substrate-binding protein n=1 Tax=Alkalicoccobacillus porphyridii TaxID=2597270 RepID=A0A553ZYG0_9BACI|nr:sugar ABC transporter substrate-binding protein [Alkalicoccobacillus porphyridii]TSB46497.1 sugar ABC transporter substrate-binding protein [Alkalicoccobacillus porphyridii]